MSNNVLPTLPGLALTLEREPSYRTTIHETVSELEQRTSWRTNARWTYRLTWNATREGTAAPSPWAAYNEHAIIVKFLDDHKGAYDSFLVVAPVNPSQTTTIPGTPYQITVTAPTGLTWYADVSVYIAGVLATKVGSSPTAGQYTAAAGLYTFAAADTTKSAEITWQGTRRVRFVGDSITFERIAQRWWRCSAELVSVTA